MNNAHHDYLLKALALAKTRQGFCSPNPSVGAVVVREGEIIGEGCHHGVGTHHAEVNALISAGELSRGATIYITLEPCCHVGKTPPCTDAIIDAQVARVYFGYQDPNPIVGGKSKQILQSVGIHCEHVPLEQIDVFYRPYAFALKYEKPFVTAKLALSLDNMIAGPDGCPIAITGAELKLKTFHERRQHDCLLTSVKTILADNPKFDVRLPEQTIKKTVVVLDAQLSIPATAIVLQSAERVILMHDAQIDPSGQVSLSDGVEVEYCPLTLEGGRFNLNDVLMKLYQMGMHSVWVEAGAKIFHSFVEQGYVERAILYFAPKLLGPSAYPSNYQVLDLVEQCTSLTCAQFGQDICLELLMKI